MILMIVIVVAFTRTLLGLRKKMLRCNVMGRGIKNNDGWYYCTAAIE